MLEEYLKLFICPDCKETLKKIFFQKIIGFHCEKCGIIFPVKDDIPIILAKEARNYDLEYPLIKKIEKKLSNNSFNELHKYIKRTSVLLMSKKDLLTWEWEDEQFWSRIYVKEMMSDVQKNWYDRIWQRELLVKEILIRSSLKNKTILSVGCGEGQNFRFLLKRYCNENSLYIATDISFEALKLNRSRNTHKNSLYVLCSADYELPFPDNRIDVLCYFGILHHTKNKSNNIQKDKKLVRKNGYIVLAETVDRMTLPLVSWLMPKVETSAHEEHIGKGNLFAQVTRKKGIEVIFVREVGTPFFVGMMKYLRNVILRNKQFFLFILNLDVLIVKTLGRIIPFFKAGEILLLARRSTEKL